MHKPSAYEQYIQNEIHRYGWEADEDNDFPCWLVLEHILMRIHSSGKRSPMSVTVN